MPAFFNGALITLELTVAGIIIGLVLGVIIALCRISQKPVLSNIARFYVWFFRGSPLMLQIMFIYFALPMISSISIDMLPAGIIALGLNAGAYLAEIIRAAIQSIDKGQMEASRALGMNYAQAMRHVIIPQSYRRLIPPIGNEFVGLLKDSSLVSVMGLTELMRTTTVLSNSSGKAIYYLPCMIFYLALTTIFTVIFSRLEKKYSAYE
ncbi:MAG TPA: ABC transporter permease [Ruminococcaceae bacterium]|nr:ABC transporter permease [Oscillospiraceae bacterium]